MNLLPRPLVPALLLTAMLSACGGGASIGDIGDDEFFREPYSSGRPASVTVSAATETRFNGTYSAPDVRLGDLIGLGATGSEPATCRFRFGGLQQAGNERVMDGEIRYLPDTSTVRTTIVVINSFEFRMDGGTTATVDRTANTVTFNGALLTNTQGFNQTVTLTGTVPVRASNKPPGC